MDSIKFSNWQWFISLASIVILFIANIAYAAKSGYIIYAKNIQRG